MIERDINVGDHRFLEAVQVIAQQLVGNGLGDLLTLMNIRAVMAKADRAVLLARQSVCGQLTAFEVFDQFLTKLAGFG